MLWRLRKWKAGKSPTPGPEDRNNHSLPQAFGSAMEVVPLGGGPELYDLAAEEKPLIPGEPRKILLVAHGETFDPEEIDYTVSLAARLGCNLVALNVGTPPRRSARFYPALGKSWQDSFKKRATAAAARLQAKAAEQGVQCRQMVKFGDLNQAVEEVNHEVKRIEFVITEPKITKQEVTAQVTLPVFSLRRYQGYQGGRIMAKDLRKKRRYYLRNTIVLGAASVALYAAVFLNEGTVTTYFTMGGLYAGLPVATALIFSFVHGSFTSNFLSALGIEPSAKSVQPRPAARRPVRRERPRLRLNA
ncbi:MAG: hypothetical protein JRI57_04825 [Deltaproteobacteria bacterium]|nr:hypothetical protein [Deltaproteobacteria bacterium]MBW1952575.1 hypothetical protein [Deltaproteobacteria bacterium]MBW1986142.1 hypothetical protein [Deltaproteobacteria bacterium]MBW2134172.1 hypothetical protein [Deltaproteobacteria bacterium]